MLLFVTLKSPDVYVLYVLKTYPFLQDLFVTLAPHAAFAPNSSHVFPNEKGATSLNDETGANQHRF